MNNTDWKRPVTADGQIDVRVGDVWSVKNGPPYKGTVKTLPDPQALELAMQTSYHGLQVTTVPELGALVSRDGVPWDVPEDKRKGRWVHDVVDGEYIINPASKVYRPDTAGHLTMLAVESFPVWLPDAATPAEPVTPAEPQPGERWEGNGMVYLPIHDGNGLLRYTMPYGTTYLPHAHGEPNFAGYYYPAHGDKASAIRSDSLRYRNPHTGKCSTRYSPGDEIVRPTHVCFVKEAE